jgi:branched-chain amino acid transport system permease protein
MPSAGRERIVNVVILALLLGVPLIATATAETFQVTLATRVAIYALAGVGLNIALGYGGLVSFGHAAFFGLGGYAAGVLASHAQTFTPLLTFPVEVAGTQFMPVIWLVALIVSGAAAALIGLFSLRTSGVHFIMITLAFAQMVYYFAVSWPAYGGEDGLSIYVRNRLPGVNTLDPLQFFLVVFAVLCAAIAFSARLRGSRFGLALSAVRQNPERAEAMGLKPFRIKLVAFILSGMVTGLAGALYADLARFVSPSMLSWQMSGEIMVFVILGGVGRLFGPVAGAAMFVVFESVFGGWTEHWQLMLGLTLLAVVLFARGGLIGLIAGRPAHD